MAEEKKVSLRLLIDPKANNVLFAEAGKDFVDFLFNLLSLPIGTLIKLVTEKGMVVPIQGICSNIEKLKDAKLGSRTIYQCSTCRTHFSDVEGTVCPNYCRIYSGCGRMELKVQLKYTVPNTPLDLTEPIGNGRAAVGGGCVAYIATDDLEVKPMSSIISGITLFNDFNVKNVAMLVEKQVQIGLIEGLQMLKASFETEAVLTSVFLGQRKWKVVTELCEGRRVRCQIAIGAKKSVARIYWKRVSLFCLMSSAHIRS